MKGKIRAVFFDIDDCLYDSTLQAGMVRRNAVRAMIAEGLDAGEDEALGGLRDIVVRFGSNYSHHFNELLKGLGYGENPRIIAAGVAAYHTTKAAYLVPFADTVPTLLELRDLGYRLGVITDGLPVKQWEKLIMLGLQHFFDVVVISGEVGISKPDKRIFEFSVDKMGFKPGECVMVGDRLDRDIRGANDVGMVTVQVLKGKYCGKKPECEAEEPDAVVGELGQIVDVIKEIRK